MVNLDIFGYFFQDSLVNKKKNNQKNFTEIFCNINNTTFEFLLSKSNFVFKSKLAMLKHF